MNGLAGRRVVVTRAVHQAEELAQPLRNAGAIVILLPMIKIAPPADDGPLRRAAHELDEYDWIIFSSANAVAALANQFAPGQGIPRARIAVVGSGTRDAVQQLGWKVDVMPTEFVAESLVKALRVSSGNASAGMSAGTAATSRRATTEDEALKGRRILIPAAAVTRDVIPRALRERGAVVDVVESYRNVMPEDAAARARAIFSEDTLPDWVTFTSSSCVDNMVSAVGTDALRGVRIASIGPVTSGTIRRHGLGVDAEPREHTVAGMVEAIGLKPSAG